MDKLRYYNIARGSVEEECRYYLILAKDLGYCDVSDQTLLPVEVSKLPGAYSRSLRNSDS